MNNFCPACQGGYLHVSIGREAGCVIVHRDCPLCGFTTQQDGDGPSDHQTLSGVRILVVDDTPDSREMLRTALVLCGASVRTAPSAAEGVQALKQQRPDVVISDIAMPDDGIALIRAVKAAADERHLRIPLIAVTAHRGRREELLKKGFAELVEKPIDPLTLCRVVLPHPR